MLAKPPFSTISGSKITYFWPKTPSFWPENLLIWPKTPSFWPENPLIWPEIGVKPAHLARNWCKNPLIWPGKHGHLARKTRSFGPGNPGQECPPMDARSRMCSPGCSMCSPGCSMCSPGCVSFVWVFRPPGGWVCPYPQVGMPVPSGGYARTPNSWISGQNHGILGFLAKIMEFWPKSWNSGQNQTKPGNSGQNQAKPGNSGQNLGILAKTWEFWPISGQNLGILADFWPNQAKSWPKPGKKPGKIMAKTRQNHGQNQAKSWPNHGQNQAKSWPNHGQIMAKTRQNHGQNHQFLDQKPWPKPPISGPPRGRSAGLGGSYMRVHPWLVQCKMAQMGPH